MEGRKSQNFGCLEGLGPSMSVLLAAGPPSLAWRGWSAEKRTDQESLPAWDGRSMGFWCSRVNLERTVSWEKIPSPVFRGASRLNHASADRTVLLQSNREPGPVFFRDLINPINTCFLALIIYLWFCPLFLIYAFTLLQ